MTKKATCVNLDQDLLIETNKLRGDIPLSELNKH